MAPDFGSEVALDRRPRGVNVHDSEFAKEREQRRASGLSAPEEGRPTYVVGLNVPRRIEIIADRLLAGGHSAAVTEKVVGANFARVFSEIWTA